MVALVRGGAAFADVVVAGNGNHAAVLRGAGHVGVLEHVGAAVHARPFAIPNAKHAIVFFALRVQVELLRAPDGGRAQLLIHPRLKDDVVVGQMLFGGPQRLVISAQRTAPVAADKTGGVQSGECIALALQQRQSHQRLHAAHKSAAVL